MPDQVVLGEAMYALATVAVALFTFLVWRVHVRQHRATHYADLGVVLTRASFSATGEVHVEVLLTNRSAAPAIIQSWQAIVRDGDYQQSIASGKLVRSVLIKVPKFVGGAGWAVHRAEPTVFSLKDKLPHTLTSSARIEVEITYLGGMQPATITESVSVESS